MEGFPIFEDLQFAFIRSPSGEYIRCSAIRQADVMLSALIWTAYSLPKPPFIFQRTPDSYISYRRISTLLFNMIPSNSGTAEPPSLGDHRPTGPNDEPVLPPRTPKITQTSPVGPLTMRTARALMPSPPISVRPPKTRSSQSKKPYTTTTPVTSSSTNLLIQTKPTARL